MKAIKADPEIVNLLIQEGKDIFASANMQKEKIFPMHGGVSTFEHSISVAYYAIYLAKKKNKKIDARSVIRGALLHDFFLYDWHVHAKWHKLHGFRHARWAYQNAKKEFDLNEIEEDIILKHMFPVNIRLPKYKESLLVDWADKVCAHYEIHHNAPLIYIAELDYKPQLKTA